MARALLVMGGIALGLVITFAVVADDAGMPSAGNDTSAAMSSGISGEIAGIKPAEKSETKPSAVSVSSSSTSLPPASGQSDSDTAKSDTAKSDSVKTDSVKSESADATGSASASAAVPSNKARQSYGIPQVAYINDLVKQGWDAHGLKPSLPATDGEWCRRVYLDVLGRIPSIEELERFTKDKPADRKLNLINRLLSDEYVEEYARNWSTLWTTLLIGRPNPMLDRRSIVNRDGMEKYLRDSFARNKPYDQMVYELVTATGSNKPGEEDFDGAVNFLIGNMEDKGVNATAKTAKIFLGLQVQCTQCHNHPFNDWKQNQFWELNAFFRQTQAVREERKKAPGASLAMLKNQDFRGEDGKPDEAILFYELRNGQLKSAFPVFVDGETISHSGKLADVNRRDELAKMIIKSNYLAHGDRQPHVGALPGLRLHQAGRRHGAAQSAVASGTARRSWPAILPTAAST